MKRMLSLVMALVLVLSLGTVAFADEVTYTDSDATSFTIKKAYTSQNSVAVNETLKFTVNPATSNPSTATLTVGTNNGVAITGLNTDITVSVPSYSVAGKYEYTIKETAGNTAGVEYTSSVIKVQVLVEYDNENHKLVIGNPKDKESGITYYIVKDNDQKTDTFTNTFSCGTFTVEKDVEGNMANENDKFSIVVTLTSTKPIGTIMTVAGDDVNPGDWTANKDAEGKVTNYTYVKTHSLSESDGKVTYANVPAGVTVTVAESNVTDGKVNGYDYKGVYTRTVTEEEGGTEKNNDTDFTTLTVDANTNARIVVVNEKETEVNTGISMDTLPYVLLLAVACVGIIALVSKKRLAREH